MEALVIQDLHGNSKSYLRSLGETNTNFLIFEFRRKGKCISKFKNTETDFINL